MANNGGSKTPEQHAELASGAGIAPGAAAADPALQAALDRIAALENELGVTKTKLGDSERAAVAAAEAQGLLMQSQIVEVPTGRMVKVKRAKTYRVAGQKGDSGRDIMKPVFHDVELPEYAYKIDLPPSGGSSLSVNGHHFYHGGVYKFDLDTLRSVKEIVYRCWAHENNIRGSNENAYRPQKRPTLSARM